MYVYFDKMGQCFFCVLLTTANLNKLLTSPGALEFDLDVSTVKTWTKGPTLVGFFLFYKSAMPLGFS